MEAIFEAVVQAAEAAATCKAAVRLFTAELEETGRMIQQRSQRQKEENTRRIAELQQVENNAGASDTQRRMAAIEIRQLETVTYGPTAAELEAFGEAKERAMVACRDFDISKAQFRESYEMAVAELTTMKEAVLPAREIRSAHSDRVERVSESFEKWAAHIS